MYSKKLRLVKLGIPDMVVAAGYKHLKKAGMAFELAAGLLLDPHGEQKLLDKSTNAAVIKEAQSWLRTGRRRRLGLSRMKWS